MTDRPNEQQILQKLTPYQPTVWEAAFLRVLARRGNVSDACRQADIERQTAYARREAYPEFDRLWKEAEKQASDSLEEEAWKRATAGVDKPIYYKGAAVGSVTRYSDTLLMFLMKGNNPDKFKDRQDITSGDKPLAPVAIVKMDVDSL